MNYYNPESRIYYKVDEKNRVVIATLENTQNDFLYHFTSEHIIDKPSIHSFCISGKDAERLLMPKRFVAVEKCDPNDTFDAEKGMVYAKRRLLRNYYRSVFRRAQALVDLHDNFTETYSKRVNEIGTKIDRLMERISGRLENWDK